MLAITVVGLAAGGAGIYRALSDYLNDRLDSQLKASLQPVYNELAAGQQFGRRFPTGRSFIPSETFGELRLRGGRSLQYRESGQPRPDLPQPPVAEYEFSTVGSVGDSDVRWRVLATPGGDDSTLYVAFPTTELEQTLRRLVGIEMVAASAVLLVLSMIVVIVYSRFFSTERLWGGTA